MVMESEVVQQAQAEAENIVYQAKSQANQIGLDIQAYGDNILGQIQQNLEQAHCRSTARP